MRLMDLDGSWMEREGKDVHVFPIDDRKKHDLSRECWCRPAEEYERVLVHKESH